MRQVETEEVVKNLKSTIGKLRTEKPEATESLLKLIRSIHREGALSVKEKELICVGISLCIGCETCIVLHTKAAVEAGTTREELMETFEAAIALRGSSVLGYISISIEALNRFSPTHV